ncbi:hypothetical protein EYC84_002509 [Monilinia fructicola]|uniref:Uncharacterized protein n=1 Tax=Monilinia fructicola TaxID=38448 RepID=A0A5M9JTI4_MONFR|nr:hypothetical protein EYC84_002509 [Monilinia fructicola]
MHGSETLAKILNGFIDRQEVSTTVYVSLVAILKNTHPSITPHLKMIRLKGKARRPTVSGLCRRRQILAQLDSARGKKSLHMNLIEPITCRYYFFHFMLLLHTLSIDQMVPNN